MVEKLSSAELRWTGAFQLLLTQVKGGRGHIAPVDKRTDHENAVVVALNEIQDAADGIIRDIRSIPPAEQTVLQFAMIGFADDLEKALRYRVGRS